jgi:hypothetical protein
MQQWEYKVVSLRPGRYTEALNEYGREGWELVSVASEVHVTPEADEGHGLPMPRALGKLEEAASRLNKLGSSEAPAPKPGTTSTTLLWVLRRPMGEA